MQFHIRQAVSDSGHWLWQAFVSLLDRWIWQPLLSFLKHRVWEPTLYFLEHWIWLPLLAFLDSWLWQPILGILAALVATGRAIFTDLWTSRTSFACSHTDMSWWSAGIVLSFVGQSLCMLGYQFMKASHMRQEEEKEITSRRGRWRLYWWHHCWAAAFLVLACGQFLCWLALGLAPQTVVVCLQCWNIIGTLALAPRILGETVPAGALTYSIFLVTGCIFVVASGPRDYGSATGMTLQEVTGLLTRPWAKRMYAASAALLAMLPWSVFRSYCTRRDAYVICAAVASWYAGVCSKAISTLTLSTVNGDSQVAQQGFFDLMCGFGLCVLFQLHFVNMALRHGTAVRTLPMYDAMSITGGILFAGGLFQELQVFSQPHWMGFMSGVLCVLMGLHLARRSPRAAWTDLHRAKYVISD